MLRVWHTRLISQLLPDLLIPGHKLTQAVQKSFLTQFVQFLTFFWPDFTKNSYLFLTENIKILTKLLERNIYRHFPIMPMNIWPKILLNLTIFKSIISSQSIIFINCKSIKYLMFIKSNDRAKKINQEPLHWLSSWQCLTFCKNSNQILTNF